MSTRGGWTRRSVAAIAALTATAALLVGCTDEAGGPEARRSDGPGCDPAEELVAITDGSWAPQVVLASGGRAVGRPTGLWIASRPAFSPDGRRLAVVRADGDYESAGPGSEDLWTVGVDGSDPRQLTAEGSAGRPSWSPDGESIAYAEFDQVNRSRVRIVVVASDGSDRRLLTDEPDVRDTEPQWSPDGASIAFLREAADRTADPSIVVVGADGSDPRTIAVVAGDPAHLTWTPDGRSLLVSGPTGDLRSVGLDGTVRPIHPRVTMPAFSQDGERLTYSLSDSQGRSRLAQGRYAGDEIVRDRWVELPATGSFYGFAGVSMGPCPGGLAADERRREPPPEADASAPPCTAHTDVVAVESSDSERTGTTVLVSDGFGNAPVPLAPPDRTASDPHPTEEGILVTVANEDGGGSSIWEFGLEGWEQQYTTGGFDETPAPLGFRTVVFAADGAAPGIGTHLASSEGVLRAATPLTDPGQATDRSPTVLGLTGRVAFLRSEEAVDRPATSVWTMAIDGSDPREVADLGPTPRGARLTWVPGGTSLLLASADGLTTIDAERGAPRMLDERVTSIGVSRDGTRAYVIATDPDAGERRLARGTLDEALTFELDEALASPAGTTVGEHLAVGTVPCAGVSD